MSDEDPELEALKRQVPPGWYDDDHDPGQQQYWDGEKWTDARRPKGEPARTTLTLPKVSPLIAVVVILFVGWLFFFNTNPGKRITAELGLRECYEITFTGEVVCGEGAERIERLKEGLGSP